MFKMRANAISFSNPIPKIYNVLPPPIESWMMSWHSFTQVLVNQPKADFKRTPLLVRRLKVSKALHWLKLNHIDYYDCSISERNLAHIQTKALQLLLIIIHQVLNKDPESTSIHDMEEEDGTTEGPCPFIVHGITGEELSTKTMRPSKL